MIRAAVHLLLFLVSTAAFIVLFEYGPENFGDNLVKKAGEVAALLRQPGAP